jgi:hypothetical protein
MPFLCGQRRRLQLHALTYNLGNSMRTLAMPKAAEPWSLTSLRQKLIKIGAEVVSDGRYVTFQLAEVAVSRISCCSLPGYGRHLPRHEEAGVERCEPRGESCVSMNAKEQAPATTGQPFGAFGCPQRLSGRNVLSRRPQAADNRAYSSGIRGMSASRLTS